MAIGSIQDQSTRLSVGSATHMATIQKALALQLHYVDFDAYPANNHPPVISALMPASGTITATQTIAFTVTDIDVNLDVPSILVYIKATAEAQGELVYGNGGFGPGFSTSTISAIANGQSFVIKRDAGWSGAFVLYVAADDLLGLNAQSNASFTGPGGGTAPADTTAPTITYSTAAGTITATTALAMSVTDAGSGLDDLTIYAKRTDQAFGELVYGGGALGPGYSTSTVTGITGGYGFSILRDAGWAGTIGLNTFAKDVAGNTATLASGNYVGPASAAETNPPVVTAVTPAQLATVAPGDTITFTVTDVTPPIGVVIDVLGTPNTTPELAYAGGTWTPEYSASTVTSITGGLQFALVRNDGLWGSTLKLGVFARDGLGNAGYTALTYSASASYTGTGATGPTGGGNLGGSVGSGPPAGTTTTGGGNGGTTIVVTTTDTTPPVIRNVVPTPGTNILASTTISFDAYDDTGIRLIIITANYPGFIAPEVLYDGSSFTGPYASLSHVTSIAGGKHFDCNRTGGWPDAPTFIGYICDTSGNEN